MNTNFKKSATQHLNPCASACSTLATSTTSKSKAARGKLEIEFEDEDETRFVISPNTPVRQIWISALTTSFKLGWSDSAQAFVLEKTGETLNQVMSRILTEKLGESVQV